MITRWETPLPELRFVKRMVDGRELRILQQRWQIVTETEGVIGSWPKRTAEYEWRDVPLVEDENESAG